MKKLLLLLLVLIPACGLGAQSIVGKWNTIDDNTGKERSVVEIFERDGLIFGKVARIFTQPGEDPDPVCDDCSKDDPRYNKKIIGMEIVQNMKKSGGEYSDGQILDPQNGRVYNCRIWLEGNDLKVRGYWGPFYRTQTWKKAN